MPSTAIVDSGLTVASPEDDLLHGAGDSTDYRLGETSYLGFNIPELAINAEVFHWFHPVLGVASGGVLIWQGDKADPLHAECVDYRALMPYPGGDPSVLSFPTGVEIRVVEPLEHVEVSYRSADGPTSFDVALRAVMPAVGPGHKAHFCQAVKTSGELVLDGRPHKVDGWYTRDRSWSDPRGEEPHSMPPIGWGAAVFDDDLAFHFVGLDSDELSDRTLQWGYVWSGGQVRSVTRMRKVTDRSADTLSPRTVHVELEDSEGELHVLDGTRQARLPFSIWPNMVTEFTQTRWTYGARTGTGDLQDVQFPSFRRTAAR
jgi:hypothetical protein